jgi:OOP family OmpA-OmpF porin
LGGSVQFLLGAGFVHNEYGKQVEGADNGATGLVGLRFGLFGPLTLRLSGTADYVPTPANGASSNLNIGAQAGLTLKFDLSRGRAGPGDSDRDGVTDQFDTCPGTPRGQPVDSRGCPLPMDADGDGVMDADDACPDTPAGAAVDPRGCPLPMDADGDGVMDADDACPDTPAGVAVDARGCPLVGDADGDGVVDSEDACPDTPAGVPVDARGCPLPVDSDGDGVMDSEDACPDTPEGEEVDARGCPILFEEGVLILEGVTFEAGGSMLTTEARAILDRVAASLIAYPTVVIEVAGHTDNTGSRAHNLALSLARAVAVRRYLISRGVSGEVLLAKGYGPDDPVASNATPEGRAQNRRVELRQLN